jgi:DNA-binding NtrC family response regulator
MMESLGTYPVLFVDADAASAANAERLMSGWGLQVSLAGTATDAVEMTKTRIFDVILISMELSDIHGYQTASIIRELGDQFQNIPIIGYGQQAPAHVGNGSALTDFIAKPLDETVLYNKLKNHLDRTRPEIVIANLDRCTDGDQEFRKELAQLLANNVIELMTSIESSLAQNDPEIFIRSVHKTKTTLSILNDKELMDRISLIQTKLKEGNRESLDGHVEKMLIRCKKTIEVLGVVAAG